MSEILTQAALRECASAWLAQGRQVTAPQRVGGDRVLYAAIADPAAILLEGFIRPQNSIKDLVFPRHEKLYGYRVTGKRIEIQPTADGPLPEQIVVAARPCDAAALPILDRVFDWAPRDEFYQRRRAALTVVTLACATCDANCFCTSVGGGPADARGSDVLLLALGDGRYEVRAVTDKGRALFAGKTQPGTETAPEFAGPARKFEPAAIRGFLEKNFEHPLWPAMSAHCLGCGICSYSCPTCHCFDIVDEGNSCGGCRSRNWDSCQFSMFTLHASGHNPRANQGQRQRQRIQHKFRMYPEKFGEILCTGCGNCTRGCPVGLGVLNAIEPISAAIAGSAQPRPPDSLPNCSAGGRSCAEPEVSHHG